MKAFVLLFSGILVVASIAMINVAQGDQEAHGRVDLREKLFEIYCKLHNRTWVREELPRRLENFWRRRSMILESIKNFTEGLSTYSMSENDFMDYDDDEWKRMGGLTKPSAEELAKEREEDEKQNREIEKEENEKKKKSGSFGAFGANPSSIDWRTNGCIPPVFSQGTCGSCFATATVGAIEATRCAWKHEELQLSYQQPLDCATEQTGYQNMGCAGGWPHKVLEYFRDKQNVAKASCYKNTQSQGQCRFDSMTSNCVVKASPTDKPQIRWKTLYNEQDMKTALATYGPIIVMIDRSEKMGYYGSGIFNPNDCSQDTNHVVVAVGYGRENGQEYWILKNSYGADWGEKGYIRLPLGVNACGIAELGYSIYA